MKMILRTAESATKTDVILLQRLLNIYKFMSLRARMSETGQFLHLSLLLKVPRTPEV